MKIIYYLKYKETPMFRWQIYHIFDELSIHGVEIELFNPLEYSSFDESNEKLRQRINKGGIDLFMTTSTDKDLYIDTLHHVKAVGIPTLLICFDNLTVPFVHKKISPYFDLVWLTSIETKYLFDKWGVNSVFLPYAANPNLFNPSSTRREGVVFIGTPYGSRSKMLNTLLNSNIRVDLYSGKIKGNQLTTKNKSTSINHFTLLNSVLDMISYPIGRRLALASIKNKLLKQSVLLEDSPYLTHEGSVDFPTMMAMYSSYDLALNSVTNRHTGVLKNPVLVVNLRSFEVPAAGGILFSRESPELESYFENGTEAIYYNSDEEMVSKASFYTRESNENIRRKIKVAARNKAINEHTWFNRFSVVFDKLGLKNYI